MNPVFPSPQEHLFDARGISKRFRHAAIFGALDALQPGEAMRFVNDHDPVPLLVQLERRYGNRVATRYRQRDPGIVVIDFTIAANEAALAAASEGCGCGSGCG